MRIFVRRLSAGAVLAASLGMAAFPSVAHAVTGFRFLKVQPTKEGAEMLLVFNSRGSTTEGHGHVIDLSLTGDDGKVYSLAIQPMADGPYTVPLVYNTLGMRPGTRIVSVGGVWQGNNHRWGAIAGRDAGGNFVLPNVLNPEPATLAIFQARAAALGIRAGAKSPAVGVKEAPAPAKAAKESVAEPVVTKPPAAAKARTAKAAPAKLAAPAEPAKVELAAAIVAPAAPLSEPVAVNSAANARLAAMERMRGMARAAAAKTHR